MISLKKWITATMSHLPRSIIPLLLPFAILFQTKKSFLKSVLLFFGAIACRGGKTVCGCLRALGMKGETAFANYNHLLSRCKIDMLKGAKTLIEMLLPLVNGSVVFVVDEHLERRRGKNIKAKATYRDPVASSKSRIVKCFGLKWVVLAMLIKFPWSKRSFALPLFCALRYPEDHPRYHKRTLKTGTDLVCQMLMVKGSAVITLKAIWVQLRANDEVILMATNLDIDALHVIEGYIKRWNIEVTFRECRDYLGIETQRQWSDLAIARTTPFLFGMYTMITLIGNALYAERGIIIESTAWYKKTSLAFSDLLEAVCQEIGDLRNITNSLFKAEFKNGPNEIDHPVDEAVAA